MVHPVLLLQPLADERVTCSDTTDYNTVYFRG